jgi:signal transduction histidine kinase
VIDRIPHAPSEADAGKLEQMLRFQEALLLGAVRAADLPGRICQGATLLVGVDAARLVVLGSEGRVEELASYGTPAALGVAQGSAVLADRRLHLEPSDGVGRMLLEVPLEGTAPAATLQLASAARAAFTPRQIALARAAATLAATALRQTALRERLEGADRLKSEVLVAMSHDLRTPLNVLIGYTRLLAEEAYGPCTSEQRDVLRTVERHGIELLSLLAGALDLVRLELEHGEPRRDEFTLSELLHELCTGSLADRVAQGVELTWHVDPQLPPMRSDRFRVRQILQNLLDNALRFTERGGVAIAALAHAGSVRLTVSDSGPGIAAGDLPHLFEIFRPGAGGAPRGASTGCGLYLVKRFSESLGGRVTVESAPGTGTRFTVDLPLTP